MDMPRRLGAEFFGTFWLTFAGCGSAVLAAGFPALGIGFLGVGLAFGLTVLTMAYAVGQYRGKLPMSALWAKADNICSF
jgi:aquaporin Z